MSNPFDFFDDIYCVNLPESADRWAIATQQFQTLGIAQRVKKIAAKKPLKEVLTSTANEHLKYPAQGMIGCSLSHLKILTQTLSKNTNNALIFEDDVVFAPDTSEKIAVAISELPPTWDILYFGGEPLQQLVTYSPSLVKVGHFWGSYGYAINRKCIPHICKTVIDHLTETGYDDCLSIYSSEMLERYCVYPSICKDAAGHSVLEERWIDWNVDADAHWKQFAPKDL